MERITLQVGSFEVNCSLLAEGRKALIVDPGQEAERILAALAEHHLLPEAILLTHGHFDHIGAIPELQEAYPELPVYVTEEDAKVMTHPLNRLPPDYPPVSVKNLRNAAEAAALPLHPEVINTPGHTPGGVCYHFPEAKTLFSGDTLFAGSVGRTDLPGGDMKTLMASMEQLKQLPPETIVVPGHGMETTMGLEIESNPFLQ